MDKIIISDLVSIDRKSNNWRLHVKTTPKARAKTTYPASFVALCENLIELRAGDCQSLDQVIELHKGLMKNISSFTSPESQAKQLRIIGIAQAEGHANKIIPNWSEMAMEYLARCPLQRFLAEDLRAWAHKEGLPVPPTGQAWGGVIVRAKKLGLIVADGYETTKNPISHHRPATAWINVRLSELKEVS